MSATETSKATYASMDGTVLRRELVMSVIMADKIRQSMMFDFHSFRLTGGT